MSTRTAPTASSPSGPQAQNAGTGTGENTRHGTISSSWTIGQSVRIKTAIGEVIEGRIFSYDLICGCLVIERQKSSAQSKPDYTIVKFNFIQSVTLLSHSESENDNETTKDIAAGMPVLGPLPLDRIRAREVKAIEEAKLAEARRGVGVTKEAQDIFDALSRTMPCTWQQQTIVVLGEVSVEPPYTVDSCKSNAGSTSSLERVKKVLEGERKRLGL